MAGHPEWTRAQRLLVIGLLSVGSALLLTRLDDRFLWQDEAETALLAKSVLAFGVPTAFDGKNLISQEGQAEFSSDDYRWFWTPWLQHYVTATSFAILGPSTFSARLPFVLFGVGSFYLCYWLAMQVGRDRRMAAIALLILLASVPYLLHMRQCRYYAPAAFFGLLFIGQYLRTLEGDRRAPIWLAVAATGLFHSHYVVFGGFGLGVALHYLVVNRDWRRLPAFAAGAGATLVLALPFLIGFMAQSSGQAMPGWERSIASLHDAVFHLNRFIFPVALIGVLGCVLIIDRGAEVERTSIDARSRILVLVFVAGSTVVALVLLMPWFFFRYYVALIPVCAVLQAWVVARVWRWKQGAAIALLAILVVTDGLPRLWPMEQKIPKRSVRHLRTGDEDPARVVGAWAAFIPMAAYLFEITHDMTGPIEEVVQYMDGRAEPGDTVIATYGDLPLQFYTGLKVVGGLSREDAAPYADADWVLIRRHTHRSGDHALKRFISRTFRVDGYTGVALPVLDRPYENRPDPTYHKFRAPREGLARVQIWHRKRDP